MPTSIEALTIVALVLTPGYICLWSARQAIRQFAKQSDAEFVISTVAVGVVVNAVVYPILGRVVLRHYRNGDLVDHDGLVVVWGLLTIAIVPVLLGVGIGRLINRFPRFFVPLGLDPAARVPSAWDFSMQRRQGCYVRVHLTDGQVVAGTFSRHSYASSDEKRLDLFLEQVWFVDEDGYFLAPVPDSGGVWIAPASIARVEFTETRGVTYEHESQASAPDLAAAGPEPPDAPDRGQARLPADGGSPGSTAA